MNAKALGIDDSVTTCDCCGKSGLKSTVVMELENGDIVHYGCVCAARNSRKTSKQINAEIRDHAEQVLRAARAEFASTPEYLAYRARLAERDRVAQITGVRMIGRIAMEFVHDAGVAEDAARARIAAKHGLKPYQLGA